MNLIEAKRLLDRSLGFYRCPQCGIEAVPEDDTVSSDEHGASVHLDCPKGGTVRFDWAHEAINLETYRDALETVISLSVPRPEGGTVMTASEALRLLGNSKLVCSLCGDKSPPIVMVTTNEGAVPCHEGCTRTSHTCQLARIDVSPLLKNYENLHAALRSLSLLYQTLRHALPYCYDPCDQTVACPECGESWWEQDTDLEGNWHAPGCNLHAARVLVGQSFNDRDPDDKVPRPNPDHRTPAQVAQDKVLEAWFARLAKMSYKEEPPAGMDKRTWDRAVTEVLDRLRDSADTGLANGPYARVKPEGA